MTRELAFAVDENGLESLGNRSIAVVPWTMFLWVSSFTSHKSGVTTITFYFWLTESVVNSWYTRGRYAVFQAAVTQYSPIRNLVFWLWAYPPTPRRAFSSDTSLRFEDCIRFWVSFPSVCIWRFIWQPMRVCWMHRRPSKGQCISFTARGNYCRLSNGAWSSPLSSFMQQSGYGYQELERAIAASIDLRVTAVTLFSVGLG